MLTVVEPGDPLPDTGQVYLLGGGEDAAQISAVRALRADGGLHRAVDRGAAVLRGLRRLPDHRQLLHRRRATTT